MKMREIVEAMSVAQVLENGACHVPGKTAVVDGLRRIT